MIPKTQQIFSLVRNIYIFIKKFALDCGHPCKFYKIARKMWNIITNYIHLPERPPNIEAHYSLPAKSRKKSKENKVSYLQCCKKIKKKRWLVKSLYNVYLVHYRVYNSCLVRFGCTAVPTKRCKLAAYWWRDRPRFFHVSSTANNVF